jgi:pimeloyl-ACP methyl ester carboxylesterase
MTMQQPSSSPTLVLLHAFPFTSAMWEAQRPLADRFPMVTLDFPGFGDEPGIDEEMLSMKRCAEFVEGELEGRGIERAILCGLSMGGYVAFECWRRFPEKIAGLILADTKATADTDEGRQKRYDAAERIGRGEYRAYVDELLDGLLTNETRSSRPDVVERVRAIAASILPETAIAALLGMASRSDSTPLLPSITVPTLLIFGEKDGVTKVGEGRTMAAAIPNARLVTIAGAGHLSNIERPGEFNEAVSRWS